MQMKERASLRETFTKQFKVPKKLQLQSNNLFFPASLATFIININILWKYPDNSLSVFLLYHAENGYINARKQKKRSKPKIF